MFKLFWEKMVEFESLGWNEELHWWYFSNLEDGEWWNFDYGTRQGLVCGDSDLS